jgi:hypothetical protein
MSIYHAIAAHLSQNIHEPITPSLFRKSKSETEHHSQLLKLDIIRMFKVHSTCITRSFELPK